MLYKTTNRLFRGMYQYKIVLVLAGSGWFRSGNMTQTINQLSKLDVEPSNYPFHNSIKTQEDLDYALMLAKKLKKLSDIDLRVESPWISIYSNTESEINAIAKLDPDKVKYISKPPSKTVLDAGTIILPKMDYDYRVTMGKTSHDCSAFVQWAETSDKLKLTKSCKKELTKSRSWGGTHFYITGDNNLLMAKMHLGGSIAKIERIIKA